MTNKILAALNSCSSALCYADYKMMYAYINKKSVEALHYVATAVGFDEVIEENYEVGTMLYDFFEAEIEALSRTTCASEWSSYDSEFPRNTYYWGFECDGFKFITNYSGVAGKHWDTLCFDY